MNEIMLTPLTTVAVILGVIALVVCYIPRIPASIVAYAALVFAYPGNSGDAVTGEILVFWGIATTIVLGLRLLQPRSLLAMRAGTAYICTGSIAGAAIGFAISPSSASVILGSVTGSFLALTAYMRIPGSPRLAVASSPFLQYFCAKSFPVIIAVSMSAIALSSVLL